MKINDWTTPTVTKLFFLMAGLFLFGCEKNTNGPDDEPSGTNKGLFVSFKTPGWSEKIDCSHLSFQPNSCSSQGNAVYFVYATSQSTKMTFQISYPVDSAVFSKLVIDREFPLRYNACEASEDMQEAISFMLVVPESNGSTNQWMPFPEMNEESHTTLTSVAYVKSDERYAYYRVEGTYAQLSALANAESYRISDDDQVISGDFELVVLTDRE